MKRAVTFLTLVISFICMTNFNHVSATSATIPSEFSTYTDLIAWQDLGFGLIGGAQFDFTDSKYVIEDYSSLSAAGKLEAERQKIKEFLQDYESARGIGEYSYDESALYQGQSYYSTTFSNNANRILEQQLKNDVIEYGIGVSPLRFADWAGYNRYWIQRYSDSLEVDPVPDVHPDSQYLTLLNKINNEEAYGFFWKHYLFDFGNEVLNNFPISPARCTWTVGKSDQNSNINDIVWEDSGGYYASSIYPLQIKTAIINGSGNTYTLTINNMQDTAYVGRLYENYHYYSFVSYVSDQGVCSCAGRVISESTFWRYTMWDSTITRSGTLNDLITWLSKKFRNINIVVNGVYWADVDGSSAPANPVIPDFPDVISGEDDSLAYDIPFPNTDNYSGSFDLTSVFDALREAIISASDNDSTTSGVLTGEGVIDTYDGVDIDTQDKVIDLISTKVFDGVLEDTTTDTLPDIPIPPIAIHNGLGGATVLAKFVDATQCILPEEVVLAFWGGFFILIILGLIKNLHR